MLRLKNHEEVYEALIEQLKEFEIDKNKYQTDVYLYVKDGKGTIDTFTNVGGNSWLDDDHYTIYSDKEHFSTKMDDLCDGSSWNWLVDELETAYDLSGIKEKAFKELTSDMDEDEKEDINSFDDLDFCEVESWLNNNYGDEIDKYYKDYFVPDCCMDGIGDCAYNTLDEFENEHSFVVLLDGKFHSDYSDYDEALEAAEELGDDAEVDVWNDEQISEAKENMPKVSRQAKYIKEKCEKLSLTLPKGTKVKWSAYAATKGQPLATYIRRFMSESMEKDNFEYTPGEN